ncbi:MAG: hypothetical protein QM737_11840 [Ferruginibacter sp.]
MLNEGFLRNGVKGGGLYVKVESLYEFNGQWTMDNGQWTMDNGQWTMDNGQWTMDNGQWTMDNGQ